MMRTLSLLTLAALLAVLVAIPSAAGELKGVEMPDTMSVAGEDLVLNGMGLRTKFFVKVYVAGLYLPEEMADARAILGADTARHLEMSFLYDVDAEKMCEAWNDGLAANTADASAELQQKFEKLCGMMSDMEDGQSMAYTYVPGEGTTVSVQGEERGSIDGKDFGDALFSCFIGPEPPNEGLKKGLLGG